MDGRKIGLFGRFLAAHVILTTHSLETKNQLKSTLGTKPPTKSTLGCNGTKGKKGERTASTSADGCLIDLLFEMAPFGAVLFISGGEEDMI